ncbi:hypothetical protein GCM10023205_81740 [Yinghuangia aomiensis]|uniref:Uncharacterized protein n=1 Tax=Yinghuangia aomiensis TaxID=676205 RepID=A0ABP9IEN7_9ACTN
MCLLDFLPVDFAPLSRVTSRDEGMQIGRPLDSSPSVKEWLLGRAVPDKP